MRTLTNTLLLVIALLLAANLWRAAPVRAASTKITVQTIDNKGSVNVDGEVVGFSS
jgi:hypothetical protein